MKDWFLFRGALDRKEFILRFACAAIPFLAIVFRIVDDEVLWQRYSWLAGLLWVFMMWVLVAGIARRLRSVRGGYYWLLLLLLPGLGAGLLILVTAALPATSTGGEGGQEGEAVS